MTNRGNITSVLLLSMGSVKDTKQHINAAQLPIEETLCMRYALYEVASTHIALKYPRYYFDVCTGMSDAFLYVSNITGRISKHSNFIECVSRDR